MGKKLKIIQYTDPMCARRLALEPALWKIEFLASEQVEFLNILGLLVGNAQEIIGNDEFSSRLFTKLKKEMVDHFKDDTNKNGMPISTEYMKNVQPEDVLYVTKN